MWHLSSIELFSGVGFVSVRIRSLFGFGSVVLTEFLIHEFWIIFLDCGFFCVIFINVCLEIAFECWRATGLHLSTTRGLMVHDYDSKQQLQQYTLRTKVLMCQHIICFLKVTGLSQTLNVSNSKFFLYNSIAYRK